MRARSWMAALALMGATTFLIGRVLSAQAPSGSQEPAKNQQSGEHARDGSAGKAADGSKSARSHSSKSQFPTIQLNLVIAGLGTEGCEVEVKPANASCKFRPSAAEHVPSDGRATIKLRDVELRGADRTCTMAITVREPGQPPQTIYRGFRPGSSKGGNVPSYTCYVSSKLASGESKTTHK